MAADEMIPVARSGWMPPRLFLLYGAAGTALHFRFIRNEERALAASLGEQYQRYRERVRR